MHGLLRVCANPDCPELIEEGSYCPAHVRRWRADDKAIKAQSPWRWVYKSRRWQGLRRQVLAEQPWCAVAGCHELSRDVDHIVPLQEGTDPFDRAGLQGLCKRHHSAKTREEVSRRGSAG